MIQNEVILDGRHAKIEKSWMKVSSLGDMEVVDLQGLPFWSIFLSILQNLYEKHFSDESLEGADSANMTDWLAFRWPWNEDMMAGAKAAILDHDVVLMMDTELKNKKKGGWDGDKCRTAKPWTIYC